MVDLKDRINKPRTLKGTPAYNYVNKAAGVVGFVLISFSAITAYFFLRNKTFVDLTKEEKLTDYDEKWLQNYKHQSDLAVKYRKEKQESERWMVN
ncbi:Tectonin beta-propeller repeat-containing protein 1 [Frankliniella fusca]|uniref:Tectonin beta-propeller repeat-containing protein 1 n=1 Tax=Frankliniella fusca TaxID=407009 RepID=A0AAE1L7F6_9NEOP|nr:Tectonin beta-propeller repeat-containing protein 1 [Frankliniella fusca]